MFSSTVWLSLLGDTGVKLYIVFIRLIIKAQYTQISTQITVYADLKSMMTLL